MANNSNSFDQPDDSSSEEDEYNDLDDEAYRIQISEGTGADTQIDHFPLAGPTFNVSSSLISMGLVLIVITWLTPSFDVTTLLVGGVAISGYLIYLFIKWVRLPDRQQSIELHDGYGIFPKSRNSKTHYKIRYEDIHTLLMMSRQGQNLVLIDTEDQTLMYAETDFAMRSGPHLLRLALLKRIRALPDAAKILQKMERRQQVGQEAAGQNTRLTWGLLFILGAFYLMEEFVGAVDYPIHLIRLGANVPTLIDSGEWFRLISANFLHANLIHIVLNGIGLLFLGAFLEKLMGPWRLTLTYGISALGGSLASYFVPAGPFSVGSSTAIFGLLGAFGALHLRHGRDLPPPFRQSNTWWAVILGLNGFLSVAIPQIDAAAHAGGFVAGGMVAYFLTSMDTQFKPAKPASRALQGITIGVVALFAVGLSWAGIYAFGGGNKTSEKSIEAFVSSVAESESGGRRLNHFAWTVAISPKAETSHLHHALRAVDRAIELDPEAIQFQDTKATILYRLGLRQKKRSEQKTKLREAIETEYRIFLQARVKAGQTTSTADSDDSELGIVNLTAAKPDWASLVNTFASQLSRFADVYIRDFGIINKTNSITTPEIKIKTSDGRKPRLSIAKRPSLNGGGLRILGVPKTGRQLHGLVELCLDARTDSISINEDLRDMLAGSNNNKILTAIVDRTDSCPRSFRFWPMTSEVRNYP